jgi:catechol 2,3-dioxygenase-like lactoylglutathione lyase family enzyme
MESFYARSVFFVKDGEASLAFYTQTLGFALDWNNRYEGRASVFQVSLFGFELIINQVYDNQIYDDTRHRAGHGRVFIGLEDHPAPALLQHIRERGIQAMRAEWGRPTLVIRDPDRNELFFWIPDSEWANLALPGLSY